jgi:hypothetical protein
MNLDCIKSKRIIYKNNFENNKFVVLLYLFSIY